jgi:hypothetical protein|tara:strand:+ start:204 stop:386 length:183 start_codon:yes stop_codon:yes gene_type:complete
MYKKLDESYVFQSALINIVQEWLEENNMEEEYDSGMIVQSSLDEIADVIEGQLTRTSMFE